MGGACHLIFVDDGEGGRGDDIFNPEFLADGFDERGLAGAHLSVERKHAAGAYLADKFTGGRADMVYVLNDNLHSFICYDGAKLGHFSQISDI